MIKIKNIFIDYNENSKLNVEDQEGFKFEGRLMVKGLMKFLYSVGISDYLSIIAQNHIYMFITSC